MASDSIIAAPGQETSSAVERLFAGPGEMRARCRTFDWALTPLGPVDHWPQSLRTTVQLCLGSAVPSYVWWGPELIQLYNDAALTILRAKHPAALGAPMREAWADVWKEVGPLLEHVIRTGGSVRGGDVPMTPERGGPLETAWFTFSYGAVRDEAGAVAGVFCTAIEAIERTRAEAAMRKNEEEYRTLFTEMDQGFCVIEKVETAPGAPVDFRYVVANPAFERHTGMRDVVGRTIRELVPDGEERLFDIYDDVVRTGKRVQFESYVAALDIWMAAEVFPTRTPEQISVLFSNISDRKRAELALAEELLAMQRLHELTVRLVGASDLPVTLREILDAAMALHGADFGNVQLHDPVRRTLRLVAQRGFTAPFLEHFAEVDRTDASACARALARGERVEIADVEEDPDYAPSLDAARQAGYRGVQSTPLYTRAGEPLGMLSTHFRAPRRLTERERRLTDIFARLAADAIARSQAEAALRESEARQTFFVRLGDALRPLVDPVEIQAVASRKLGEHLGTSRVAYLEIDGDEYVIARDYVDGIPSMAGRYPVTSFGPGKLADYRAGQTRVVNDTKDDPHNTPSDNANFAAVGVRAGIGVPLVKDGVFVANLVVHMSVPRQWTPEEVALVEATAERTWAAVLRARSEMALRESEAQYRSLFETMEEGFALCELVRDDAGRVVDYRFLQLNRAFNSLIGHPRESAVGRLRSEVLPGDDEWMGMYTRVVTAGEPIHVEHYSSTLDRWYDVRAFPRPGGRFAVLYDEITERKRAEIALRTNEERYRLIVDGARDYAILTIDGEGRIESWSPGAEAAFGWSTAEAMGQPFAMTFTPEDRAATVPEAELARARDEGVAPDVRWHLCRNGERVFIEGSTRAIRSEAGEVRGFLKIGQDVTRRRAQEEALRASEARYRTLVENVQDYAIFLLDPQGMVTEWTTGAVRVKGYTAAEVLGRHLAMFYTPEDQAAGKPEQELAEAKGTGRVEQEGWRVRKGGERFWANEIVTAARDADGTLVGFTMISRDLTERRRAEEAAELARLQAERDSLRRRLAQAEEDERRRLSRELHDEVGQHLTALGLGLQALSDVAPPGSEVDRRAEQLRGIVSTMGRELHALAVHLRPKALDDFGLEAALAAFVDDWSRRSGIAIDLHAPLDAARLAPAIESAIYRIVQEALTNVARHSGATRASVVVERRDGFAHAIVEDDGQGFDMATANDEAELGGGYAGLGLLGIRERVALLGGTVDIESSPGHGTTLFARILINGLPADHDVRNGRDSHD